MKKSRSLKSIVSIFAVASIVATLTVPTFATSSLPANAQRVQVMLGSEHPEISQELKSKYWVDDSTIDLMGEINYDGILINGVLNPLFYTFKNPSQAMSNIKKQYARMLSILKDEFSLGDLDSSNWEQYKLSLNKCKVGKKAKGLYSTDRDLWNQYYALIKFFDVYENDQDNAKTIQMAKKVNQEASNSFTSTSLLEKNDSDYNQLVRNIPYFAPNAIDDINSSKSPKINLSGDFKEKNNGLHQQVEGLSKPNDANSYAMAHGPAGKYNRNFVYISGGDCTNFVSQICSAGGVPQDWHSAFERDYGWWYRNKVCYSHTWAGANNFARYFGNRWHSRLDPGKENAHFEAFSKSLYANGVTIIGLDYNNDGSWDHMACVVARELTERFRTPRGGYYYDFKVAQHSNDYVAWATESPNNWDIQPTNAMLGIFS